MMATWDPCHIWKNFISSCHTTLWLVTYCIFYEYTITHVTMSFWESGWKDLVIKVWDWMNSWWIVFLQLFLSFVWLLLLFLANAVFFRPVACACHRGGFPLGERHSQTLMYRPLFWGKNVITLQGEVMNSWQRCQSWTRSILVTFLFSTAE